MNKAQAITRAEQLAAEAVAHNDVENRAVALNRVHLDMALDELTALTLSEKTEVHAAYDAEVKRLKAARTVTVTLHTSAGTNVITAFYPHQFAQALEFFTSYIQQGKQATITNVL